MMNENQAVNILTDLANRAQQAGIFRDINDSGTVYTALLLLTQRFPPEDVNAIESGEKKSEDKE